MFVWHVEARQPQCEYPPLYRLRRVPRLGSGSILKPASNAIGDALGNTSESLNPSERRARSLVAFEVVSRSWWKSEKASRSGELSHNSHPLGGGCRRMTPWKELAGADGTEKVRWKS